MAKQTDDAAELTPAQMRKILAEFAFALELRHEQRWHGLPRRHTQIVLDVLKAALDDDEGGISLDREFGFVSRGGVTHARREKLKWRNRLLFDLWRVIPAYVDLDAIGAAARMSIDARRYESSGWRHDQRILSAPATEPNATWWRIYREGLSVPDKKALSNILKSQASEKKGKSREIQKAV